MNDTVHIELEHLLGVDADGPGPIRRRVQVTELRLPRPESATASVPIDCPHCDEPLWARVDSAERLRSRRRRLRLAGAVTLAGALACAGYFLVGVAAPPQDPLPPTLAFFLALTTGPVAAGMIAAAGRAQGVDLDLPRVKDAWQETAGERVTPFFRHRLTAPKEAGRPGRPLC